jgi:hypothetical protein
VSKIFFDDAIVSVWCYFDAALSIVVLFLVKAQSNIFCKNVSNLFIVITQDNKQC